jgi:hypothetical protein
LSGFFEELGAGGHRIGKQSVVVFFAEAVQGVQGRTNEINSDLLLLRVRNVILIDEKGLTKEFIGQLLNSVKVSCPVHCLASLKI